MSQPEEELMTEFERQLTQALRPVDPPQGFAERTLARAKSPAVVSAKVVTMKLRPQLWASGAVAAGLFAGVFVAGNTHQRHQREKSVLAQRQFEVAMRITDETLEQTRQQLQQAGIRFGN